MRKTGYGDDGGNGDEMGNEGVKRGKGEGQTGKEGRKEGKWGRSRCGRGKNSNAVSIKSNNAQLHKKYPPLNPTPSLSDVLLAPSVIIPLLPCQTGDFTAAAVMLVILRTNNHGLVRMIETTTGIRQNLNKKLTATSK